jgi:hypothetical protein
MEEPAGSPSGEQEDKSKLLATTPEAGVSPQKPEAQSKRQLKEMLDRLGDESLLLWFLRFGYKECKAVKDGWFAFLFLLSIFASIQWWITSDFVYAPQMKTSNDEYNEISNKVAALSDELEDTKEIEINIKSEKQKQKMR